LKIEKNINLNNLNVVFAIGWKISIPCLNLVTTRGLHWTFSLDSHTH